MCVSYDGTAYSGWQLQDNAPTIEGELNKALTDLCGEPIAVIGASRTDAGVHALCNMAVYDTNARMPGEKVYLALNVRLPKDIRVVWSREVEPDFHPRHRLTEKTYEYHIWNSDFMPPTLRLYTYQYRNKLDIGLMNEAAKYLEGEHDFKSFASVNTTAETTVRKVNEVLIRQNGDEVIISVRGNGFLYNMVRAITGTVLYASEGKLTPGDIPLILESGDRTLAGPTVPPGGLYMTKLWYEDERLND